MNNNNMISPFLLFSAVLAGLAVAMGAFGAHGLRATLSADAMKIYQTAVDYHMWHALGLGLIALLHQQFPDSRRLFWAGGLMLAGVIIFSGSLYLLAISGVKWLGAITPLGGVAFIVAWVLLAVFAYSVTHQT